MKISIQAVLIALALPLGPGLPGVAQASLAIYTDGLVNGFQDWSYATHNLSNTAPVHSGVYSISVNTVYWNAISFHHTNFDSTPYASFTFWVNGGAGGQSLAVYAYLNDVNQNYYQIPGVLPANTWQQVVIPLSALGAADKANLSRFDIKLAQVGNSTANTFYVDDVQLAAKTVTVDTAQALRQADARWFGANTAIWEYGFDSPDTLSLMNEMGCRTLRFPGGSFSDEYHWASNYIVGSSWERWPTSFGNFMDIATNLGANVFITANYGTGTADEAADWVRSANITNQCGFKYWEIGNECYGTWEMDSNTADPYQAHDPWTYAMRFSDYYTAMKAADPTIKVGIVVVPGEDNYVNNYSHSAYNPRTDQTHYGWTPVVLATLSSLGVTPDFMVHHFYPEYQVDSDPLLLQAATNWAGDAADLRQQINDYFGSGGENIELLCTENNADAAPQGVQSTSLVNGLYLADSMSQIMKTEFNSYLWWIFENGQDTNGDFDASLYGWRTYGDFGLALDVNTRYPTFYAMKLMQYFVQPGDTILNPTSDYPLLSVYAASNSSGTVSLLVINKDPTNTLTSDVALAGYVPHSVATVRSYGIPQDEATRTNGPAANQDLAVGSFAPVSQDFTYAFPPYSLILFTFTPAVAPPLLTIFLSATNTVVVQWPSPSTGWNLQQNTDLTTGNWGAPSATINDDGTNRFIVVDPTTGNSQFFRLSNP
ncbi:MAG: alpha-L-arabinofuranosidase [Verrucomicrobiia bacterium]